MVRRIMVLAAVVVLAGCGPHKKPTPATVMRNLPKEDPKAVAKEVIEATMEGKVDKVMGHTEFASGQARGDAAHLIPPSGALEDVRRAMVSVFGNAVSLGDDPLPSALSAVDNATVRFEPEHGGTARVVLPPPGGAITLVAAGGHWKVDYERSQTGPARTLTADDKKALDELTKQLKGLAAAVRAHKFGTEKEAAAELQMTVDPARRKRAAATQARAEAAATMRAAAASTMPGVLHALPEPPPGVLAPEKMPEGFDPMKP